MIIPLKNESDETVMYLVNFIKGGFIILSADNRIAPVRAFSLVGELTVDDIQNNIELNEWFTINKNLITDYKHSDKKQLKELVKLWKKDAIQDLLDAPLREGRLAPDPGSGTTPIDPEDDSYCTEYYKARGPLMETEWYQTGGFNDKISGKGCSEDPEGRPPVGCVAVAIGQVMNYLEYPSNYKWASMPAIYGNDYAAQLLKDIGDAVNMHYNCDGSWAYSWKKKKAFTDHFSYSSAEDHSFSPSVIRQEINWNYPVILSASKDKLGLKGHAWVCDGYIRTSDCIELRAFTMLHMNWGWGPMGGNGWYASGDFGDYDYNKKMVYKIRR